MMVKRFGCNSGFAVSFIYLINYWFFFVIYRRTYRCSSCHMFSRYQAYSRKVVWQYIQWTYIKKLFRCHGKGDIQESHSYRVQDSIMACMRSTSTTSTASTTFVSSTFTCITGIPQVLFDQREIDKDGFVRV